MTTRLNTLEWIFAALATCAVPAAAQDRNEIALSVGHGDVIVSTDTAGRHVVGTSVGSFSYQVHVTKHASVEGSIDLFWYTFPIGPPDSPSLYHDDYLGASAAAVYSFRDSRRAAWSPFVSAGIGKTSTDFTEIAGTRYYRLGGGVTYHLRSGIGVRVEGREDWIADLAGPSASSAQLLSVRVGVVRRF